MLNNFTRKYFLVLCCLLLSLAASAQTANFTANFTSGCAPLLVQFTNTSTGTNANTTYNWNFGNGAPPSALPNPSTTYANPGTYTVTLTVSNGPGSSNTKTVTNYITVYPSPQVSFAIANASGCPGTTVSFTSTSIPGSPGNTTYTWNFGDGNSGSGQTVTHTYNTPGNFNVALQVTNSSGCTKTRVDTSVVHIYTPPNGSFTANTTSICNPPGSITFTGSATGTSPFTYDWTYGDNTGGSGTTPVHTYNSNGTYTVTMIVTDGHGCKDTVAMPNYITVQNVAGSFTAPTDACIGTPVTFTNTTTTPSGTNASWNFGDNTTDAGTIVQHTYTTAGTYTVKMAAVSGACTDTVTHTITIHPKPSIDFSFSPTEPCPAPAPIQFTNLTTGGSTYTWLFGDNGSSTQTNPSHTYNGDSVYTVTLVATSQYGCTDTLTRVDTVKVYDLQLRIFAHPVDGCAPLTVNFAGFAKTITSPPFYNVLNDYPYPIATYSWDFDDGTYSTSPTPAHTFNNSQSYWVKLTITTANGCTVTDSVEIHPGLHPTANFTAAPLTTCIHDSVQFTNTSLNATNYEWFFGDGGASTVTSPSYHFTAAGVWDVMLVAVNYGCRDTLVVHNMVTALAPKAKYGMSYACDTPTKVTFTDITTNSNYRMWYFGDGGSSNQQTVSHVYASTGIYNAMLVVHNDTTGCWDTAKIFVDLWIANPNFVANDTAVCKGDTVTFTATNTLHTQHYTWIMDNHIYPDSPAIFKHMFPNSGIYSVTMNTIDEHGCPHATTKTNYILNAWPDVGFSGTPTVGCTPLNVQFNDTTHDVTGTSIVSRSWTFGDGNGATPSTAGISHIYTLPGSYNVKLVVTDNVGCKDSLKKNNYIEARHPSAGFAADDTSACIGQTINFANNTTGVATLTYEWSFGDNTSSTAATPTHQYAATGTYTVRLIATDASGCKDTMTKTNYITITKPDAAFAMDDTLAICPPLFVNFTNQSTGATAYNWNFGNNNTSFAVNPTNPYNNPGQYTIRLIAINSQGCTDTAYHTAYVLGYGGALSYSPLSGCSPLTVNFSASVSNVPSMVWDFNDGVTAPGTGGTISHTYLIPGAYVPKLIISDGNGCLASNNGNDTIKVDGVIADFTVPNPVCEKTTATFTDNSTSPFSTVNAWTWYFNTGAPANGSSASHYYPGAGTFPVLLVATNGNGCKDSITKNVTVRPLPVIDAGKDTVICLTDAATLVPSGGVSYVWSPGGTLSCTACTSPQASPTVATYYTVIGTDAAGCKNTDSVKVSLKTKTVSSVGNGGEICAGTPFQLQAIGGQKWQWTPSSSLNNSQIANPIATPFNTTNYMMVAWEGSCIPDTNYVNVIVHQLPNVNAGADQRIIAGTSTTLQASGTNAVTYVWSPVETLSCDTCANPTASPKKTTEYSVVAVSDFGCLDTDKVTVYILCDQSQVFIPNSFTPNGDGRNDYFYPRGKGIDKIKSFRIYNRWGELVFEKTAIGINDKINGWDGTYNGVALRADVFVYMVEAICDNGEPINWKGDVSLIR